MLRVVGFAGVYLKEECETSTVFICIAAVDEAKRMVGHDGCRVFEKSRCDCKDKGCWLLVLGAFA
jgi:hypothetical protein